MPWLPEEHMADVHIIRQDYARARNAYEANPTPETKAQFDEQYERRGRAMRSLHRDDSYGVRVLAAMFRCSKQVVRDILAEETE